MNYFNYFTEIEETFIRRRGKHLLLSPLDWALIENWKEREIPLRIVLRGIENVFDAIEKKPGRPKNVKSLSYCKDEIEALLEDWRTSQVGKTVEQEFPNEPVAELSSEQPNLFSTSTANNHLKAIIGKLEIASAKSGEELRPILVSSTEKLKELRDSILDAESLEDILNKLEADIDRALLDFSKPEMVTKLKSKIEQDLSTQKSMMDHNVYERTVELMLLKYLREEVEIPRLSLFYL